MQPPFWGGFFMKHHFLLLGASSGIGLALAEKLVQKGHKVVLVARRAEPMRQLQSRFPEQVNYVALDLTDVPLENELRNLGEQYSEINRIVYLAGWGDLNPDLQADIELKTQDLNTRVFTQVAVWGTHFLQSKPQPVFANISSIGGIRGSRMAPAYNASKAYQINYWEGLKQRARKHKMTLCYCDIRPGFVNTDMAKGEGQFWVASTKKAARQLTAQLTKSRAVDVKETIYLTKRWKIIAIILKILPTWLYKNL
jgi:short-subunit dehydrogenase